MATSRGKNAPTQRRAKPAPARKPAASTLATGAARKRVPTAANGGPLTLAQAQSLVAAQAPMRAAGALAPKAVAAATAPLDMARERRRERLALKLERRQRIDQYTAVMQLLKQRGVRGLASGAAPPGASAAPAATGARPLQVFAEGDSWFDYPVPLFGGGIIPRLERRLGLPILNLASAGDEVRYMMGVDQRQVITTHLRNGCPAGGAWDALLFSGGGNDIVDDPMALWVRDYVAGTPVELSLHQPRFMAALGIVRAGYEDLIVLRDRLSPSTHLIFHTYDHAIPDGRGICGKGPWLKPSLDLRGYPNQQLGFETVRWMLTQFAQMLLDLQATHARVTVLNGQGTLAPVPASWHNELHPSKKGFDLFADKFLVLLRTLFPAQVPA